MISNEIENNSDLAYSASIYFCLCITTSGGL
jgi:hypothetical protein